MTADPTKTVIDHQADLQAYLDTGQVPKITVEQLDAWCALEIEEAEGRMAAHEERSAIVHGAAQDGLTAIQRAQAALQRRERFPQEHACARAFIRDSGA